MSEDLCSLAARFYECFGDDALRQLLADDAIFGLLDGAFPEFGRFRRSRACDSREGLFERFCADLERSSSYLLADLQSAADELGQAQTAFQTSGMSRRELAGTVPYKTFTDDFTAHDTDSSIISSFSTSFGSPFVPRSPARAVSANLRRRNECDAARVRSDLESGLLLYQLEQLRGRIKDSRARQRENAGELRALQKGVIASANERAARQYGEEDALCDSYRARAAQLNDQFEAFRAELRRAAARLRDDGIANVQLSGEPIGDARSLVFALVNYSESESVNLARGSQIWVQQQSIEHTSAARRVALENQALRYKIQALRDRLRRLRLAAE